jgi:hypothetical protein
VAKTAFISYASEDESVAGTISEYLERTGVSCWIAPRDVRLGADYGSEIIDGIESSSVMVLVLSEHANSSEFVKREVERAVAKGKPIFPVRVREVVPSKSLELFISSAEWVDAWQPPIEQYLGRLADSIRTASTFYAPHDANGAAPALPGPMLPRRDFQRPAIIALGLVVIVLSVLLARSLVSRPVAPANSAASSPSSSSSSSSSPAASTPSVPTGSGAAARGIVPAGPDLALSSDVRSSDPCPRSISISPDLPTPFSCTCSAEATAESNVWGTDAYTDDSGLCRSALHAGVVSSKGGLITVTRGAGKPLYVGTTRNGVTSNDYPASPRSIEFKGTAPPPPGPGLCPKSLAISRELPTPFTCRCSAEAAQNGSVWGTDVYTDDSAMCRAAFHAGRIPLGGGVVTVMRGQGRALYVGTTRNGVVSYDYPASSASITFR